MTLRKLALFQSPSGDVIEGNENTEKYCSGYIRISEYTEVEFKPVPAEEIKAQIAKLDEAKASAKRHFLSTCERLDRRRAEMEALPVYRDQHQPIPSLLRKQAG